MSLQYLKKELSYEVDVLHADKHESLFKVDSIIFDGFGQACPKYPGKFAIFLWHRKKEFRNEVRDFTALAGSNIDLSIYTSNIPPTIHIFLLLIWNPYQDYSSFDGLCNTSSLLLFQVIVGPCKLACFFLFFHSFLAIYFYWIYIFILFGRGASITSDSEELWYNSVLIQEISLDTYGI